MIRVFTYPKLIKQPGATEDTHEYSCIYCYTPIKWDTKNELSPWDCPKCKQPLMDISNIMKKGAWRMIYHFRGAGDVACNASLPL